VQLTFAVLTDTHGSYICIQTPEAVARASDKALTTLLDLCVPALEGRKGKAMDMGAAYGGCARQMAKRFHCQV
jgi:hypothetical protein